ncbi:hypothetical protein ABHI18_011094 [Aspergillus niger]
MRLLLLIALFFHCSALNGTQIAHDLQYVLSSGSRFYFPNDAAWDADTTQRFDTWHAPTYIISIKPALVTDVQEVVRYASFHGIPFLATGGGHGYSGSLGALENGIELDLGYFNSVTIDTANNMMTVGGAVTFSGVEETCYRAGKAFPVGACSCVGVAGASLGGGIGFYSGLYGAISDSLVSADIITGTGAQVTASETQNSDLLWALKGAGSSYGVVTSLTYRIYDFVNDGYAMNADMVFPASQMSALLTFANSWLEGQPKELSIILTPRYDATQQELLVTVNVVYAGPLAEGHYIIRPLLDLAPQRSNVSYLPWYEISDAASFGAIASSCDDSPRAIIPYSLNLYEIDVEALTAAIQCFNDAVASTPALQNIQISFTQYAQYGFQQHLQNSSSFPYRDVAMFVEIDGVAAQAENIPIIDAFEREFRDRLVNISGRNALEVYMQFAHGDEGADAWFSAANVPKLRRLKELYDPLDLFRFYNSVNTD